MLASHTPLAEMLTVVLEHVITILAESGTSPSNHFRSVSPPKLSGTNPDRAAQGKLRQRHFFYRTSVQAARESAIVHDATPTNVDTVMGIV